MYPSDRKYTRDHEWVKIDGSEARVGITDYAQKQLGDVVYLDLPEVGRSFNRGESFGTVESVKGAVVNVSSSAALQGAVSGSGPSR